MFRYFVTPILMTFCTPALAGTSICWIDHVTSNASGVQVFFKANANIWGQFNHRPDESERRYFVRDGRVVWPDREEAALLIKPGEISMVVGGVENTCNISFSVVGGRAGIYAKASFTPPGVQSYAEEFIPAETFP